MTWLIPLLKGAYLWDSLFGPLDIIACVSCRKKYAKWQEYCDKCGSDYVMMSDPRVDGHHFLNLPVSYKELVFQEISKGITPEALKERVSDLDELDLKTRSKFADQIFRGAKFIVSVREQARASDKVKERIELLNS